jgi:hypothetical protein
MVFTHLCRRYGVVDAFPLEDTSGGGGMWGRGVIFLPGGGARPRPGHTGGQLGRGEGWGYEAAGCLARRPAVQTLLSGKVQKKSVTKPDLQLNFPLNLVPAFECRTKSRKKNCAKLGLIIDGQVRLKTNTSVCFIINRRTNDKLPFAPWANGKRINKNRLGFRFRFETATYIYSTCLSAFVLCFKGTKVKKMVFLYSIYEDSLTQKLILVRIDHFSEDKIFTRNVLI